MMTPEESNSWLELILGGFTVLAGIAAVIKKSLGIRQEIISNRTSIANLEKTVEHRFQELKEDAERAEHAIHARCDAIDQTLRDHSNTRAKLMTAMMNNKG